MNRNPFYSLLSFSVSIIFILGLTACKWEQSWEQSSELSQNREKWEQKHISNYQYKVSIISIWGANRFMPLTVQVKDREVVLVLDKDGNNVTSNWKETASVESMFAEIETALSRKGREAEVVYDNAYGFPTYSDIFYNERGVGGEYHKRYTVSDLEVLPNP